MAEVRVMDDAYVAEVLSAAVHGSGLPANEGAHPRAVVQLLRRERFPLLSLAAGSTGDGRASALEQRDLRLLRSDEFRAALAEDRARYELLHSAYVDLVQRWAAAGVRCICFKSAGIPPSFPYAGNDLDVLVPAAQVEIARQALSALGYELVGAEPGLSWQYRGPVLAVHLHARIGWHEGYLLDDEMWARARVSPDDSWTWIPGREDVVLINVAHALVEKRALTLRSVMRIRHALRHGPLDWKAMDRVARERGWLPMLALGLTLTAHLEERLWGRSMLPVDRLQHYSRLLDAHPWLGRYPRPIEGATTALPCPVPPSVSGLLLFEKLWRDQHVSLRHKGVQTTRIAARGLYHRLAHATDSIAPRRTSPSKPGDRTS